MDLSSSLSSLVSLRTILLISTLLLAVGSFAAVLDPKRAIVADRLPTTELEWVRTADGWERPARWQPPVSPSRSLHPAVVAGLLAMAAVGGLVGSPVQASTSGDENL